MAASSFFCAHSVLWAKYPFTYVSFILDGFFLQFIICRLYAFALRKTMYPTHWGSEKANHKIAFESNWMGERIRKYKPGNMANNMQKMIKYIRVLWLLPPSLTLSLFRSFFFQFVQDKVETTNDIWYVVPTCEPHCTTEYQILLYLSTPDFSLQ